MVSLSERWSFGYPWTLTVGARKHDLLSTALGGSGWLRCGVDKWEFSTRQIRLNLGPWVLITGWAVRTLKLETSGPRVQQRLALSSLTLELNDRTYT